MLEEDGDFVQLSHAVSQSWTTSPNNNSVDERGSGRNIFMEQLGFHLTWVMCVCVRCTYLGLDHVDSSGSQLPHTVVDVDHAFSLRHVQHDVNHDETTCTPRPRTDTHTRAHTHVKSDRGAAPDVRTNQNQLRPAVDHRGAGGGRSLGLDAADEAQQPGGVERHTVIGPTGEMKLSDLSDLSHAPLKEEDR